MDRVNTTLLATGIFMQSEKRVYCASPDVSVVWIHVAPVELGVNPKLLGKAFAVGVSVQASVPSNFFTQRSMPVSSPVAELVRVILTYAGWPAGLTEMNPSTPVSSDVPVVGAPT